MPLENLDDAVGKAFAAALDKLGKAGARLSDESLPAIDGMNEVNKLGGGITPTEAYAVHRDRLARRGDDHRSNSFAGASSAPRTIPPPTTSR